MGFDTSIIIYTALPGMVGGLVRGLIGISKHVVRDKEPFHLPKLLFSLLLAVLVGSVAGALTEGDWRVALLAGFAGTDVLESLCKTRLLKSS